MKVTVNLAVDENVINQLKDEASDDGMSLNKKINKVLEEYITFGKRAKKSSIIIPKKAFGYLIETSEEKNVIQSWDIVFDTSGLILLYQLDAEKNLIQMIDFIKNLLLWTNAVQSFIAKEENNKYSILIGHEYGIKWSKGLAHIFNKTMDKFHYNIIKIEVLNSTVVIDIFKRGR